MRTIPVVLYRQTKTTDGKGGFTQTLDYPLTVHISGIEYHKEDLSFISNIKNIYIDNVVLIDDAQYKVTTVGNNQTMWRKIEATKLSKPVGIAQPDPTKVWVTSDGVQVVSNGDPVWVWQYPDGTYSNMQVG